MTYEGDKEASYAALLSRAGPRHDVVYLPGNRRFICFTYRQAIISPFCNRSSDVGNIVNFKNRSVLITT